MSERDTLGSVIRDLDKVQQGPHPFSAIDAATVRYGAERQLQPSPVPTAVSSSEIDALPACNNATAKKGDKLWEVSNTLFVVNEAIKAGRTLYGKKLTSVRDFSRLSMSMVMDT